MTREGTRLIAVLTTAVLAAALLAACGGSDSTTDASTPEVTSAQQSGAGSAGQGSSKQAQGGGSQSQNRSGTGTGASGNSAGNPAPLQVSGGGSAQFHTDGGDNSIQEFGEEGGESELTEAAEALHGYLVARAEEDPAKACSYLAKSEQQQLQQLASKSPQLKNSSCPAILGVLSGGEPLSAAVRRELTEVDAASLRIEGEEGFLIYRGGANTNYFMRMENEDGAWKVTALSPTALP